MIVHAALYADSHLCMFEQYSQMLPYVLTACRVLPDL